MNSIEDISHKRIKMIEYAKKLRKKFPNMKKERLARKVAEYFHIKLIAQVELESPAVPISTPEK